MPRFILLVMSLLSVAVLAAEPGALFNARIHTLDPDAPAAEAMAWNERGRIVFLGASDELNASHPELPSVDMRGKTILPGLIDAHGHVMGLGLAKMQADLTAPDSLQEAIATLEAHAETLPQGVWLTGRGWDQTRWPGQAFPTAADLDQAFPERPVWLVRVDSHAGWANSAALALATK
ncbi:MAG: amidohydrolase family protein, partial [Haliea sp.]